MTLASEKTKRLDAILDASVALFARRGFGGTTTAEIADAAGITKRTLYRYVSEKQQILYEVYKRFISEIREKLDRVEGTPVERVRELGREIILLSIARRLEVRTLMEESKHLAPAQAKEVRDERDAIARLVEAAIRSAVEAQQLRPVDPTISARAIVGAGTETYRWMRLGGELTPEQVAAEILDVFFHGVATQPWVRPATRDERDGGGMGVRADRPIDRLANAAAPLFRERGYHSSSTRDISDSLGVTKGALFYHAGTKEELLLRIHAGVIEVGLRHLSEIACSDGDTIDKLRRIVEMQCWLISDNQDAFAVTIEEMKYLAPAAQADILQQRRGYNEALSEVLVQGRETGDLRFDDVSVVTNTILGILNSTYRWYDPEGPLSPTELAQVYCDIIFNGFAADSATSG